MAESIKAGLYAYLTAQASLTALVNERIYHREMPQNPVYPAIVYSQISDVTLEHTHDQYTGPRQARIQFDCYAETVAEAENLIETLYDALIAYRGAMGSWTVGAVFDEGANPEQTFKNEVTLKWIEQRSRDFLIVYYG